LIVEKLLVLGYNVRMSKDFYERLQSIKLNISYYRKKLGFTQENLAEKLNISRTHLSNMEALNMNTGITLEMLFEIADVLKLDVTKLLEIK